MQFIGKRGTALLAAAARIAPGRSAGSEARPFWARRNLKLPIGSRDPRFCAATGPAHLRRVSQRRMVMCVTSNFPWTIAFYGVPGGLFG